MNKKEKIEKILCEYYEEGENINENCNKTAHYYNWKALEYYCLKHKNFTSKDDLEWAEGFDKIDKYHLVDNHNRGEEMEKKVNKIIIKKLKCEGCGKWKILTIKKKFIKNKKNEYFCSDKCYVKEQYFNCRIEFIYE